MIFPVVDDIEDIIITDDEDDEEEVITMCIYSEKPFCHCLSRAVAIVPKN